MSERKREMTYNETRNGAIIEVKENNKAGVKEGEKEALRRYSVNEPRLPSP